MWLMAIANALAAQDPENRALYLANAHDAKLDIEAAHAQATALLMPITNTPLGLYHDAFHYYEDAFGLSTIGALTGFDDAAHGPARLADLQAHIAKTQPACFLAEANSDLRLLYALVSDDIAVAEIDPLGGNLPLGPKHYPALITDLANDPSLLHIPPAVPPLRRRLELVQLISGLLDAQPDLAPRSSLFDLADSLMKLTEEMHGEGVSPDTIMGLDISDQSGHWERALGFIGIAQRFFGNTDSAPDVEARQRQVVSEICARWEIAPPENPIIIAGSTGSRGATAMFMQAVAKLPQGAIILPGFDFSMPAEGWSDLADALTAEDHPQFRFRKLLTDADCAESSVVPWSGEKPANQKRNALVSLALRPAPVTDQWLRDGPKLGDVTDACRDLTLV